MIIKHSLQTQEYLNPDINSRILWPCTSFAETDDPYEHDLAVDLPHEGPARIPRTRVLALIVARTELDLRLDANQSTIGGDAPLAVHHGHLHVLQRGRGRPAVRLVRQPPPRGRAHLVGLVERGLLLGRETGRLDVLRELRRLVELGLYPGQGDVVHQPAGVEARMDDGLAKAEALLVASGGGVARVLAKHQYVVGVGAVGSEKDWINCLS